LLLQGCDRVDWGRVEDVDQVLPRGFSTDLKGVCLEASAHIASHSGWPDVKPGTITAKPDPILVELHPQLAQALEDVRSLRNMYSELGRLQLEAVMARAC
jgi:hypothetical protein